MTGLRLCLLLLLAALGLLAPPAPPPPFFLPDDPLRVDPDRLDVPPPGARARSETLDFLRNSFGGPAAYDGPALNVNTVGDVPRSSWFAERHYARRMTPAALQRGPNTGSGPVKPWQVVGLKQDGKTVGLRIEDAEGEQYLLKLDPPTHPELTTGAEIISTKLLYALGYHVPENYLAYFTPDDFAPAPDAALTRAEIMEVLDEAPRTPDGRYRALASRFVPGAPLGPFLYYGTRPDDANDLFPHEARRELRGLRVFAAWLNHTDARSQNTLDVLVEAEGRTFIRHYLIDFGSTLGASARGPQRVWSGYAYGPAFYGRRILTLGLSDGPWDEIPYPELPAVGRFEAAHFDPHAWVPQYPNPAFRQMDARDAFWAAARVMHFTDEEIRAIVATGAYTNPAAARYLARTLIERRDRIGRTYLPFGGGLDRFHVDGGALAFTDLLERYDLAEIPHPRQVTWHAFDNTGGDAGPLVAAGPVRGDRLAIPAVPAPFLVAELTTPRLGLTRAYLRRTAAGHEVVGVERCARPSGCRPLAATQAARAVLFDRAY